MENKYKSIEILEEGIFLPTKINVIFEDETIKTVTASKENYDNSSNECYKEICQFAKQEDYTSTYDFIKNSGKVVKKLSKETSEEKIEEVLEVADKKIEKEEAVKTLEPQKEETKKSKKRTGIKITAISLAAIIGVLGVGYTLIDMKKQNDHNRKQIAHVITQDLPKNENAFTERLDGIMQDKDKVKEGLIDIYNGHSKTQEEYQKILSDQAALAESNMYNVSQYINGGSLTGDIYYPDFTSIYNPGSVDYKAVEYFSALRNNIITSAYDLKKVESTKAGVDKFNEEFIKFVLGNQNYVINFNGKDYTYTFDSLSPLAKNTVISMGMSVLTIERDFEIEANGMKYNRQLAIRDIYELDKDIYQELTDSQSLKKR